MAESAETSASYKELIDRGALILGLLAFVGCSLLGIDLLSSLFRAAIVYFVVSIAIMWLGGFIEKMIIRAEMEIQKSLSFRQGEDIADKDVENNRNTAKDTAPLGDSE